MNKALLILDIDETLIYASKTMLDLEENCKVFDYYVYERPYLKAFLDHVEIDYELALWSSASDDYVEEIVKQTQLKNYTFKFIWGRSRATYKRNNEEDEGRTYAHDRSHYHYVKSLQKVKKMGYRMERILIVDDSPHKSKLNYGNAIYPRPYMGNIDDNELLTLANYLSLIKDCENFRKLEKRTWRLDISK